MTNTEAAEEIQKAIDLIRQDGKDWLDERDIPILEMAINALTKEAWKEEHPVSPLLQKLATNLQPSKQEDLISRQAANAAICNACGMIDCDQMDKCKKLFTAQPETHEERTETHACDCIERQAAIDSICRTVCDNPEICESPCDEIKVLETMPSAQPKLNKEKISDLLWNEYQEMSSHLSTEGVVARRYFCKELWKELFGEEETPVWMTW